MTKAEKLRKARRWVRDMQKLLPCVAHVYVSAIKSDHYGECAKTRSGFEIRLDWDRDWDILRDFILPHEYAHARVWGRLQAGTRDHDAHFGVELMTVESEAGENLSGI